MTTSTAVPCLTLPHAKNVSCARSDEKADSQNIGMLLEHTNWNVVDNPSDIATISPPSPTGSLQMRPFSPTLRQDSMTSLSSMDLGPDWFGDDDSMMGFDFMDLRQDFLGDNDAPLGHSSKASFPALSRSNSLGWSNLMPFTPEPEPSDGVFDIFQDDFTLDGCLWKEGDFEKTSSSSPAVRPIEGSKTKQSLKEEIVKGEPSSPAAKRMKTGPAIPSFREVPKENAAWDICLTPEQAKKHRGWAAKKRRRVKYGRKYVYTNKVNIAKARKRVDGKFEPGEFGKRKR